MTVSRDTVFQLFKYTVYVFLAINVYLFFDEEFAAAQLQFPNGISLSKIIEGYSATIDTAAWVVLLLMFELETYVLEDKHFTKPVTWSLHGLRTICYAFIMYALYGYITNLTFVSSTEAMTGLSDLCSLPIDQWFYVIDLDEYAAITASSCGEFSTASEFVRLTGVPAVVDVDGLENITGLAWIDVINAGVWLIVVLVLEVDVRLQERNLYEGLALKLSTIMKVILYSTLLYAAIYWGIKGDFVDFWDAFLWLIAFVFIELNVFEWRAESKGEGVVAGPV